MAPACLHSGPSGPWWCPSLYIAPARPMYRMLAAWPCRLTNRCVAFFRAAQQNNKLQLGTDSKMLFRTWIYQSLLASLWQCWPLCLRCLLASFGLPLLPLAFWAPCIWLPGHVESLTVPTPSFKSSKLCWIERSLLMHTLLHSLTH
jgi:hypothetical protein